MPVPLTCLFDYTSDSCQDQKNRYSPLNDYMKSFIIYVFYFIIIITTTTKAIAMMEMVTVI